MRVVVTVMPKKTVLDPQGEAVRRAMRSLGHQPQGDVRVGKRIVFDLPGTDTPGFREQLDTLCRDFLSNPIIEDFSYELEDVAAAAS